MAQNPLCSSGRPGTGMTAPGRSPAVLLLTPNVASVRMPLWQRSTSQQHPRSRTTQVGMEQGKVPPGEAAPAAQHSCRGPGFEGGPCQLAEVSSALLLSISDGQCHLQQSWTR